MLEQGGSGLSYAAQKTRQRVIELGGYRRFGHCLHCILITK